VKNIGLLALIVAVMLGMASISGNAQSTSGTILGTLTDATGAVVGNTNIQLINQATATKIQAKSNDSGYYQFVDVAPGTYKIVVQKEGFKQLSRAGIVLQTEARIQVDLALQVGASTETVEVTASTPLIEADNVSLGTVVDERETNELPLNGRNPMNLTALVTSVVPLGQTSGTPTGVNPQAWGNYQIGGGMAGQSSTYIDGAPDNGIYDHNTEIIPSQDSIQEFKVETNNLSAEYGRLAGGAINFTTKSGSKDLHGGAWEFIRNKVLNANNYFNNLNDVPRGSFTQNQYGFNVGGPVFIPHVFDGRKKTFFFVNWDGFGLRQGETVTTTIPTTAVLAGDLSAYTSAPLYDPTTTCSTTVIAGVRTCDAGEADGHRQLLNAGTGTPNTTVANINPTSLGYLQTIFKGLTPTQNTPLNNFTANASGGGNNYQTVAKIDHDFSDRNHLSGRYTYWKNNSLAVDPLKSGVCANGSCAETYQMHNVIFDDTATLSTKTILDVRLSYSRYHYGRTPDNTGFDVQSIGWPSAWNALTEFPGVPAMVVSSLDQASLFNDQGADSTIKDAEDTYRIAGTLTRFVGNHTLKAGAEFTRQLFNYVQTNTSAGLWTFNTDMTSSNSHGTTDGSGLELASYLLGYPDTGGSAYNSQIASASLYPAFFITDDWRATQKLTFHLGVRWENTLPFTERHDRISFMDTTAPNDVLAAAALPGVTVPNGNIGMVNSSERSSRYAINPNDKEFSPRVGTSYRIAPNTVINAGYGIFWLPNDVTLTQNPGWDGDSSSSTPYVGSTNGYNPTRSISNPYPVDGSGNAYVILPAGRSTGTGDYSSLYQYQVNTLGSAPTVMTPNNAWAYTQQWNFGVQQQLGKSTAIDVSYAGAKGTHLPAGGGWFQIDQISDSLLANAAQQYAANPNVAPDISVQVSNPYYNAIPTGNSLYTSTVAAGQLQRPFPQYNGVSDSANVGDSTYNALEVKVQKRFSQGASINVAYTFSKFISDTDTLNTWLESVSGTQDNNDLRHEKALSSSDAPQRLVIAYVYDIPVGRGKAVLPNLSRAADYVIGGWGLQGLTTLMKGFPLGMSMNSNTSNSFGGGQRPNVVPGCSKKIGGAATQKLGEWFNTSCFVAPASYTFGNESRLDNSLEAPGVANWDMSVVKKFAIDKDGRVNLQFRAEFFNLFNRVQFGVPNTSVGNTNYGQTSSQQNLPRIAQFALRMNF
jgi:hypothetical protein